MESTPVVTEVRQIESYVFRDYMLFAATALTFYEYAITIENGYNFLRSHRQGVSSWLFVVNRYILLISSVLLAFPFTYKMCYNVPLQMFIFALQMLSIVMISLFSALRAFALLNRSFAAFCFVLLLGFIPVATNIYSAMFWTYTLIDNIAVTRHSPCHVGSRLSDATNLYLSLSTCLSLFIADFTVWIVTWIKTRRHVKEASSLRMHVGISATLFRDGNLLFAAQVMLNISQMVFIREPILLNGNPITTVAQVVQSVLMSRFLVNLRKANQQSALPLTAAANHRDGSFLSALRLRIPTVLASLAGTRKAPSSEIQTLPNEPEDHYAPAVTALAQIDVTPRDMSDEQNHGHTLIEEVPR